MSLAGLPLRDYQAETIDRLTDGWRVGRRRLAAVLPTGAGKTVIFAHMARRMAEAGGRTLILAHRDELIEQAVDKLCMVQRFEDPPDGSMPAPGVLKARRRELEPWRSTVVASVQTAHRERSLAALVGWARGRALLVVVDEAHHVVAESYMKILRALGCFDEARVGVLTVGFTATLARSDGVALGEVWEDVAHRVSITDLIRRRYLLDVRARRVHIAGLDLARVRMVHGDYQDGALGDALMECLAPAAIARAYVEHAGDRQGIVFMPTVETAYAMADELERVGVTAACVEGRMSIEDRRLALKRSAAGEIQVLTNCMVLTEGTDLPHIDVGVIGRPTKSPTLFVQMAGRILRPYPGQETALLLDVVGVGARHRLASLATLLGAPRIEAVEDALSDEELAELSLLGLAEQESMNDGSAGARAPEMLDGTLDSFEYSLFEGSVRTWLQTKRGVWFIEAGADGGGGTPHVVFLVPAGEPGRWSVAAVPTMAQGGRWVVENVDMGYAMAWGEQEADALGGRYTRRSASWRRGSASERQLDYLKRLVGVNEWLGMAERGELQYAGQVSDVIAVARASARIDHLAMVAGVTR
ncbi:MAG TPA: DEAD/DEAH box helicase [Kribbellaceae bacterium]|nr:DEAD/DEAH box helicase [Kribbellaceae bacterium]